MPQRKVKEEQSQGYEHVTTIEYRGFSVPIFMDEAGQQFFCEWEGNELGFGAYNTDYKKDLQYLIDQKLDVIKTFSEPWGARLEYFYNGEYRDVKLVYRGRILKVFLNYTGIDKLPDETIEEITLLATKFLSQIKEKTENKEISEISFD